MGSGNTLGGQESTYAVVSEAMREIMDEAVRMQAYEVEKGVNSLRLVATERM